MIVNNFSKLSLSLESNYSQISIIVLIIMLYFFLLFPLNNCLYITEGISILEEGYNFGI